MDREGKKKASVQSNLQVGSLVFSVLCCSREGRPNLFTMDPKREWKEERTRPLYHACVCEPERYKTVSPPHSVLVRSWWSHAGLPSLLSQPNGVAEGIQILPAAPYISLCTHSTISLSEQNEDAFSLSPNLFFPVQGLRGDEVQMSPPFIRRPKFVLSRSCKNAIERHRKNVFREKTKTRRCFAVRSLSEGTSDRALSRKKGHFRLQRERERPRIGADPSSSPHIS